MKIDTYCQQRNCSPLNVLFSDVYCICYVDIAGLFPLEGVKKGKAGKTCYFQAKCVNISKTVGDTSKVTNSE